MKSFFRPGAIWVFLLHTQSILVSCFLVIPSPNKVIKLQSTRLYSKNSSSSSDPMDILRQRMEQQEQQYARLLMEQYKYFGTDDDDTFDTSKEKRELPESVYIILFEPDTPQQHIHTIEFPKGSGNNIILAFEEGADSGKFAVLLRDLGFSEPSPEETDFEPLAQHCQSIGMPLAIVPAGFELTPPQLNTNDGDGDDDDDDEVDDEEDDSGDEGISLDTESNKIVNDNDSLDAWG